MTEYRPFLKEYDEWDGEARASRAAAFRAASTERHRQKVMEDHTLVPRVMSILKLLGRNIDHVEPDAMTPEARRLMRGRIQRARKELLVLRQQLEPNDE